MQFRSFANISQNKYPSGRCPNTAAIQLLKQVTETISSTEIFRVAKQANENKLSPQKQLRIKGVYMLGYHKK